MEDYTNIEKDYRKWIMFNNQLSDFQNLYELYSAVGSKKNIGGVAFHADSIEGKERFIIKQKGHDPTLELNGEAGQKKFLDYLILHFLPNQDIEEWYKTKAETRDKSKNHSINNKKNPNRHVKPAKGFIVHPKESKYYNLRIFFSALFYLVIVGIVINLFLKSSTEGIIAILSLIIAISIFALIGRIVQGLLVGIIKGNSVKINEHQYPEIFKIINDQAREIGLTELPDIYISSGHFNAYVTKLARKKYLTLYSEVIETTSKGNFEVLKFVIGHELGHLKRRHLNKEIWLMPSSLIPFLKLAYSRACEYTCDRIGYHFSRQGSLEGILILATGKEIHSKINIDRYIDDANTEDSFWVWLSEKFLTHPHTYKRLTAIKRYDKNI